MINKDYIAWGCYECGTEFPFLFWQPSFYDMSLDCLYGSSRGKYMSGVCRDGA